MLRCTCVCGTLLLAALAAPPAAALAAPPWAALFPFQRVEADPQKSYQLTEEHGPWLILCTTFGGANGKQEAQKLALELRRDFQLEAYTYAQHYDFNGKEQGLGYSRSSTAAQLKPRTMKYLRRGEYDEWAVMVGHFPGVEDANLQAALHTIKHAQPKSMQKGKVKDDRRFAVDIRELQRFFQDVRKTGPLVNAFATRNPLLPDEGDSPDLDPLVLEMNQGVEHSLLNCPGKYTVRVATFRGRTTIDQREIGEIERGKELQSTLDQAANKANKLTTALRAQGVEAYEFHDRIESIVCVGSFDTIGTPREDGKMEMSPAVMAIMNKYGATAQNVTDQKQQALAGLRPKSLGSICFDVQPWPVSVPKSPAASIFNTGLFR